MIFMGLAERVQRFVYDKMPGVGKPPQVEVPTTPSAERQENRERIPTRVESGSEVSAKYLRELDQESGELKQGVSEDTVLSDDELKLYAVADGLGSGGNGAEASQTAMRALRDVIRQGARHKMSAEAREDLIIEAFGRARRSVEALAKKQSTIGEAANTTLSAILLDKDSAGGDVATIGHVGDSVVYQHMTNEKVLVRLSRDPGALAFLVRENLLSPTIARSIDQSMNEGKGVSAPKIERLTKAIRAKAHELSGEEGKSPTRERLLAIAEFLENRSKMRSSDAGQLLYGTKDMVEEGLRELKNSRSDQRGMQVLTVKNIQPGDVFLTVTDGMVLTEERMREMIAQGIDEGKPMGEIVSALVSEARADQSPRQKGRKFVDPSTGKRWITGDDVGASGVRLMPERAVEKKAAPAERPYGRPTLKLVEAEPWREDPGLVAEWENDLAEAERDVKLAERYLRAIEEVALPDPRRFHILALGAQIREGMVREGKVFPTPTAFATEWKRETGERAARLKTQLQEAYKGLGMSDKLVALEAKEAEIAEKEAKKMAM